MRPTHRLRRRAPRHTINPTLATAGSTMPINEGRFVWHDLATTDVEGAKAFYSAIAPWTTTPWDDDGDYFLWERDGAPVGGMSRLTAAADQAAAAGPPNWMPSVFVYDVDATVRRVSKLGGTVLVQPREVPHVGCWAIIAGPEGAPLSLFEPSSKNPPGHAGAPRVGEFAWHELSSDDWQRSLEFYRQLVGWELIRQHDMGANGTYVTFGQKGEALGGMYTRHDAAGRSSWTSYVEVPSVKQAMETVKSLGGRVMDGPHEVPGGSWIAMCSDPQGAAFAITSNTM
jgi:predicted enzyme related to lactoylglutathione lyase